jgi:hypothetical protein
MSRIAATATLAGFAATFVVMLGLTHAALTISESRVVSAYGAVHGAIIHPHRS